MLESPFLLFMAFALLLVGAAGGVVTARNPVHAALFLVLAFFTASGLWLMLDAEFLAIALVLVYVGAVMVLFLFVVMMLDIKVAAAREGFIRHLPVGIGVALIMLAEMVTLIGLRAMQVAPPPNPAAMHGESNVAWIGTALYTQYLLPFEVAAMILTVGIVAAVALTLRHRGGVRHQNASQQVAAVARDRVRLVSMPAERGDPGAQP